MSSYNPQAGHLGKLKAETIERLKELACINRTTEIIKEGKPVDETLQKICFILPQAWQYPEFTCARIIFDNDEFRSPGFSTSRWMQIQEFETIESKTGSIEIYYFKAFPECDEGPFLKEERQLLVNLAGIITGFLNSVKARSILKTSYTDRAVQEKKEYVSPGRNLLQLFLNKNNSDRDIYHDLMPFKVREILLVANLYDAYSIEKEGRFSEHVLGEYAQLNLTSLPRITGVSSQEDAFVQLNSKHFDLVIIMMGTDKKNPVALSEKIKKAFPYIPVFMLLNNNNDIAIFENREDEFFGIDRIFVWNGDSNIFFAMIKLVEDYINVHNDTEVGLVRVILLVEDSAKYYSLYLPTLYQIVLEQTRRIIDDVTTDDQYKILRLRARPKILLATTYEQAMELFNRYKDFLLCLITDVKFRKGGIPDEDAGVNLVQEIREQLRDFPVILQSSNESYSEIAYQAQATFINKNSESLIAEIKSFIQHYLGFGNFIYRDKDGKMLAEARSLKEFEDHLKTIPDESLLYHARKNHFSLWLMARGEIQAAKILSPKKVSDFKNPEGIREYLISVIQKFRNEQNTGKVIPYEDSAITDEKNIVLLSDGPLGGKGRGLSFVNNLIYAYNFANLLPNINLKTPKTSIIGTTEFEYFIERNKLYPYVHGNYSYEETVHAFLKGKLTDTLIRRLKVVLKLINKPLAIRSSGMFEDSLMQPFAGIFETYLLPNNHPDLNVRLQQTTDAIKLVYASVYSKVARDYIKAINYKIEEEKMAVIIQEVVGKQYEHYYYPHISGVAQSYNYYPFAHMKPEEGFAVAAVGLGKYVVEGGKAYRFSPKYPSSEISSPKDQFKNSQVDFYAVDLRKSNVNLLEGDTAGLSRPGIEVAEMHGTLKHCASVYDANNHAIVAGINQPGPRIINFSNILRYNYIPLAQTIDVVLDVIKEAMGSSVEIEFAVDLNKDKDYKASFYLLQIKPLFGNAQDYEVDMEKISEENILMFSERSMGNGLIDNITDVIYVDPELFDKSRTEDMVEEIEMLNHKMAKENRNYILIGPGRWGTRDRWIGIPVNWSQISNAKVIIETSLEGFPLDASSGSHFFHNVTTMNVGYFSVHTELGTGYIRWQLLEGRELIETTRYFRHIRYDHPLKVRMDGKKRISVISVE